MGKQRCICPVERNNNVGIDAVEKDMLLILDIICITQVTGGELLSFHVAVSKRRVWTQCLQRAELRMSTRQVEKHVFGKDVRRMSDQSPFFLRKSTLLVIIRAFAVVFSRMRVRIRCPVL